MLATMRVLFRKRSPPTGLQSNEAVPYLSTSGTLRLVKGDGTDISLEGGSGPTLSDATPADLGSAGPGTSDEASRADHVHAMPSAADVGAVPTSRTVNGHALSANVTLTASDVGALSTSVSWSGDLAGTGSSPTLAAIGSTATKGSASRSPTVTIDTKGRVTSLSDAAIAIGWSQITSGLPTTLAGYGITNALSTSTIWGGDLGGTGASPTVLALHESGGTRLPLGTINDNEPLVRASGSVASLTAPSSADRPNRVLGYDSTGTLAWVLMPLIGILGRGAIQIEGRAVLDVPNAVTVDVL
jgi:hypothetical protein